MEASIIVTYRCNAKCVMCDIWRHPTRAAAEIKPEVLEKLPVLDFCNITGGEPFIRQDLERIVEVLEKKAKRIVISTNGYYTKKIVALAKKHPDIGIRVSIEGLPAANDELRGLSDGFDHGLRTLLELKQIGLKDIGFGITVSDRNAADMVELYHLAKGLKLEFATAALHNSFYFHKQDNRINNVEEVSRHFDELIKELLKTKKIKNWFRAYFNYGLINYIQGKKRLLPCQAGIENFFVDPTGEVLPCNGMEEKYWFGGMGNLNEQSFEEIWHSEKAEKIREKVRRCPKNCWMIGTVSPVMKKNIWQPAKWVIRNKLTGYRRNLRVAVLGTRGFPDVQGGVEKHCEKLYPRLAALGCEVRVYARKGYVEAGRRRYENVEILPVASVKLKSLEAILHTLWALIHARFDRRGFDIVHIHAIGPSLLTPVARLLGFKVVTTNHGPDYDRQKWNGLAKAALKAGEFLGAEFANEVIAISHLIKNNVATKFRREAVYIPNGVEVPELVLPGKYLPKFGLEPRKYILAVGRLVPEKGFQDLLEAFKAVNSDWRLAIVGGADHQDSFSAGLKQLAASDKRVVMTGRLSGEPLAEIYSNAGLFVLPSYHEGLPIVLLEALSYGLPVLCSSIPANTEVINDRELLFAPGDIKTLSNKLNIFIAGENRFMHGIVSPRDRLKQYNWDAIAKQVLEVYRKAAGCDSGQQAVSPVIYKDAPVVNRISPVAGEKVRDYERVS